MEDSALPPRHHDDPHHDNNFITLTAMEFPQKCFGPAIMLWNFFYTFRRSFNISAIPFDHFIKELRSKQENRLMRKLIKVVLFSLLNERDPNIPEDTDLQNLCKNIKKVYLEATNNKHNSLRYRKNTTSMKIILQTHSILALKLYLLAHGYFGIAAKREQERKLSEIKEPAVPGTSNAVIADASGNGQQEQQQQQQQQIKEQVKLQEQDEAAATITAKQEKQQVEETATIVEAQQPPLDKMDDDVQEMKKEEVLMSQSQTADVPRLENMLARWEQNGFYSLEDEEKVLILHYLTERCLGLKLIRDTVDQMFEDKRAITRERYFEHMDHLHKQRDELEVIKNQREALVKDLESCKAAILASSTSAGAGAAGMNNVQDAQGFQQAQQPPPEVLQKYVVQVEIMVIFFTIFLQLANLKLCVYTGKVQ